MADGKTGTPSKRFTETSFDKFTNKTIVRWVDPMNDKLLGSPWVGTFWAKNQAQQSFGTGYTASLDANLTLNLGLVESPGQSQLKIYYQLQTLNNMSLSSGRMIVNLDEHTNVNLNAVNTNIKFTHGNHLRAPFWQEEGYYILSKAQLKTICEANTIALRLAGSSDYIEPDKTDALKFQFMCRSFVMEVFDDHTYDAWINKLVPAGSEGYEGAGCVTFVGYPIAWFIFPVGFFMGLYLMFKPRFDLNDKMKFAFSPFYRINGLIISGIAVYQFMLYAREFHWFGL